MCRGCIRPRRRDANDGTRLRSLFGPRHRRGNTNGRRRRGGRFRCRLVALGIGDGAHRSTHARALLDAEARRGQIASHLSARMQDERLGSGQISFDLAVHVDLAGAHRAEHDAVFSDTKHPGEVDVSLHAANDF